MKSFKNLWITPDYIFVVSTFSSAKSTSEFYFTSPTFSLPESNWL